MPTLNLPFLKGDRSDRGIDFRDALPVNTMAVMRPVFTVEGYITSHPGLKFYSDAPGRDRGAVYNERQLRHYRVSGNRFIEVTSSGVVELGVISGVTNPRWSQAVMPYSFNTQAIITDQNVWLYDGTTLLPITDPDLGDPIDGVWINSYYVFTDGETLYHTELDNEFSIEPDDFATSEFSPDPTLGLMRTSDNNLMVLNRYTTEYFFNDPSITEGFAFTRIQSKAITAGIVGTHLKCELDGNVFCVGGSKEESPTILVLSPGRAQNVSTREIDKILSTYTEAELANLGTMESRVQDRDQLVYVRLPRHTLLYNHTVAMKFGFEYAWSTMTSGISPDSPWVGVNGVYDASNSLWIYGDRFQGRIASLDNDSAQQYGEPSEITLYSPFTELEGGSIDSLKAKTVPGYAPVDSVTVFFSMTYDGHSWGEEWPIEYGGESQYKKRFKVNRLGYIRYWFGVKLRTVTVERLAFADFQIDYG